MIKLIVGLKGSGKTKTLINMANEAGYASTGSVICIAKGNNLLHEIKYFVRLIDVNEYDITTARSLYGFIAGIFASNHDITDIFVDSALKICSEDLDLFVEFIKEIDKFGTDNKINFTITSSIKSEDVPQEISSYIYHQ